MKRATLPPVRIDPAVRKQVEDVLREGETLSSFVAEAVRQTADLRKEQAEFIRRGLASEREAEQTGQYVSASAVLGGLKKSLSRARRLPAARRKRA